MWKPWQCASQVSRIRACNWPRVWMPCSEIHLCAKTTFPPGFSLPVTACDRGTKAGSFLGDTWLCQNFLRIVPQAQTTPTHLFFFLFSSVGVRQALCSNSSPSLLWLLYCIPILWVPPPMKCLVCLFPTWYLLVWLPHLPYLAGNING